LGLCNKFFELLIVGAQAYRGWWKIYWTVTQNSSTVMGHSWTREV